MPALDFTEEQRRVIEAAPSGTHPLVVAAPGSGKTRVIAGRIAALLRSGAASPEQALALTFTQHAAGELRQRLAGADVWAGTFHAYCADLLESHGAAVGVRRPLRIYDEPRQREALIAAIAASGIALPADERTQRQFIRDLRNAISARKRGAPWFPKSPFRSQMSDDALDWIADAYDRLLGDALDYDDLILRAAELLRQDQATAESLHYRLRFVFIDEFHDVSAEQYDLIQLMLPPRAADRQLMAVADPDQSIYGWRGAHAIETLDRLRRDYRPAPHILTRNHRSTPEIVAAADAVMADHRDTRRSTAAGGSGFRVACFAFDGEDAEADAVARLVERARADGGYTFGDIALLYRSHARADRVEAALLEHGIPVWRLQQDRFYDQPEVQEGLRYLDLALALHDDQFVSALNWPRVLVDECTMVGLRRLARSEGVTLCALAGRIDAYADRVGPLTRAAIRDLLHAISDKLDASLDRPIATVIEALLAILQQRRDAIPRAERETLHGVLAFLGAPLAGHAARLAALPAGQTIALRPAADDADAAAAAVILQHALGRYLGRRVVLQRPDEPRDQSAFAIDFGIARAPSPSGFGLAVRRTREFGYSLSTQAWRLGQLLLIAAEVDRAQSFVVFDLETGDRHPSRAEVIEVAALRIGDEPATFRRLVRPSGPRSITAGATEVHGLEWRDVRDAPPASAVLPDLLSFFGDATLVGHNIEAFDYPVLRRVAREQGLPAPVHDLIDTFKMARRLLPEMPSHRLEDLGQRFGIDEPQQHRALADVALNARVFAELTAIVRSERELDALSETLPLVALGIRASGVPIRDENETLTQAGARAMQFGQGADLVATWRALAPADAAAHTSWLRGVRWESPADDDHWRRLAEGWRAAVAAFERAASDRSLAAFLRRAALATSIDFVPTPDDPSDAADPRRIPAADRVAMMTIHSAKGLEWPLVIIVGAEDGQMPFGSVGDLEEERRVLFVGMTRARSRLFLTWSEYTLGRDRSLSRFLDAVPPELIEHRPRRARPAASCGAGHGPARGGRVV